MEWKFEFCRGAYTGRNFCYVASNLETHTEEVGSRVVLSYPNLSSNRVPQALVTCGADLSSNMVPHKL